MTPVGYMAKHVENAPDWLGASRVDDIYSVSGCISKAFADYIPHWKHNGYWLFDSPDMIRRIAGHASIPLSEAGLFYYEVYEHQFRAETGSWEAFGPEPSFPLNVEKPQASQLEGYDVATFSVGTSPECSPLSCNGLARDIETNRHCLLSSLEAAKELLETGQFTNCEPGPYRIFAVYSLEWP
jgi:hypothetical protein